MQIKSVAKYFWVFGIIDMKIKANKNRSQNKYDKEQTQGPQISLVDYLKKIAHGG